jgi:hypothetical protein
MGTVLVTTATVSSSCLAFPAANRAVLVALGFDFGSCYGNCLLFVCDVQQRDVTQPVNWGALPILYQRLRQQHVVGQQQFVVPQLISLFPLAMAAS